MHYVAQINLDKYIFIKCGREWIPCNVYWEAVKEANNDKRLRYAIEALEEKYISEHAHRIMAERANKQ